MSLYDERTKLCEKLLIREGSFTSEVYSLASFTMGFLNVLIVCVKRQGLKIAIFEHCKMRK